MVRLGMTRKPDIQRELNEMHTSLMLFLDVYNKDLPLGFPPANKELLQKFKDSHPLLFDGVADSWSVDKHRKRVMDWLSSHAVN